MRQRLFFIFFSLWTLLLPANSDHQQKNIFILGGQSNMAGRGGIVTSTWDGIVPPQCDPDPSILRLDARLSWAQAHEPLHAGIDLGTVGIGPGMAFARALLATDRAELAPVGLVPCAMGGTNITQWEKGSALYRRMVRRARAAVGGEGGGTIRALLWYQGESDTVVKEDAEAYGRRLDKFFGDIRMDLMSPMLPIIQVALASGKGRFIDTVREAQFGIDLLNLRTVDAKGLALRNDNLHLTTDSQVRLGKMMADSFIKFLPSHLLATNAINASTIQTSTSTPTTTLSKFVMRIVLSVLFFNFFLSIFSLVREF